MSASLFTRQRLLTLSSLASTQLAVQVIGFLAGVVLVRSMAQSQYGLYTLAVGMTAMAGTLTDLGLGAAVMAQGGRVTARRGALGGLVADAQALHGRIARWMLLLLLPCFAWLLWRQQAPVWLVGGLAALVVATGWLNVRSGLALAIVRLLGHTGLQQRLDLCVNIAKLAVLTLAAFTVLDAGVATAVNLAVALAGFIVLRRFLQQHAPVPPLPGTHHAALREQVWRQAPNSIYFVVNSQVALWLIGVFGNAERVAEVGALGRLGALFAVIGSVTAALVMPYFARNDTPAALSAGFNAVNAFYAALLALLVALAASVPGPMLWVLGGTYRNLQAELVWMVAASTLAAWGGTLYGMGCSRGWVLPVWLAAGSGLLTTIVTALAVDVATVRGSFMINTATGLAGTVVAFAYFRSQLQRHAQLATVPS